MPRTTLMLAALVAATLLTGLYMSTAETNGWGHVLLASITSSQAPNAV